MDKFPLASVVITTKDRFSLLSATLQSLASQTYPFHAMEVFVIDAGSDETREGIEKIRERLPYRLIYRHCEGFSISAGRNVAIKEARGETIVILDDDVFPAPNFVEAHVSTHLLYPQSIVQGELLPAPGTALFDRARLQDVTKYRRDDSSGMNHCNVHTFNVSVPRKHALGELFDENIDQYGWEDVEWGYRLVNKKKLKLRYSKEALAFHYKPGQTYREVANDFFSAAEGMIYFLERHPEIFNHKDSCQVKKNCQVFFERSRNFVPLTLSELMQKRNFFSSLETRGNLPGTERAGEEVLQAYHEIERYAEQEGAWCRLNEIPVEKSVFSAEDSELFSCLLRWPVLLRYCGPDTPVVRELSQFYWEVFDLFCGGREQKTLTLEIFPCGPPENVETPYAAAVCIPSLWKNFPSFLSSYREILVPSSFDQTILSEVGVPSSLLPFGMDWEDSGKELIEPSIELPGVFAFFADAGYDPVASGIAKLIAAFGKTFKNKKKVALVLAFHEGLEILLQQILAQFYKKFPEGKDLLIFPFPYQSSFERRKIMASSDCVVYAGIGESIVPSLVEAAATGKGILATEFGGHLDFLDKSSCVFLPCEIVKLNWRPAAQIQEEAFIAQLRYVYEHPSELKEKGEKAEIIFHEKKTLRRIRREAFLKISEVMRNIFPLHSK